METNHLSDLLAALESRMPSLSKGQKCIANFLINHYDKAVYLTAAKLGETIGVSESTVVRFAIELGFEGYPQLQKALEELVKTKLTATQRVEVSSNRLSKNHAHILKNVLQADADRILRTLDDVDYEAFDQAVDEIVSARKVYVIGGRSASSLTSLLAFYLNIMRDDVIHINTATSVEIFEQIFRISENDVCIGISFPRYSQRTVKAMEYANTQNAKVISITDSVRSPIADVSKYCLIAKSDMVSFVDSLVAPLSVINALLVAVSVKKKSEVVKTLDKLETFWKEYQIYSQKDEK